MEVASQYYQRAEVGMSMLVIGSYKSDTLWYNDDDIVGFYRIFAVFKFLKSHC